MKFINYLNRIIEYSFYAIFFLVPLFFSGATSELFEFPKMWLTFGLTVLIGAAWIGKMILQRRISIQRTPLDIPILLFLLSQIISTIFSIDQHVSIWGYYSRFNGGLLSIIAYIFLYYALVSNFSFDGVRGGEVIIKTHETGLPAEALAKTGPQFIKRLIAVGLFSGLIVALWGLPSHFGIDPTCYIFRGNFDASCWTDAFKPTIRIFSTLGQPAWLAAYATLLAPIAMALSLNKFSDETENNKQKNVFLTICFLLLSALFYLDLLYTNTRAGFIAFVVADILFWLIIFLKKFFTKDIFLKLFLTFNIAFLVCSFLGGVPIESINKFTLPSLTQKTQSAKSTPQPGGLEGTNITDSGKIRLLVWTGAIKAWEDNKLFGTGVETFAFSYYKYKPAAHNLTSEWDFLYNKAHNEYLNYLTTTGIFGLGSYLLIIGIFLFQSGKWLIAHKPHKSDTKRFLLIIGLLVGYISILISNFFGFSVVIINLYFFLIPAFVFILGNLLNHEKALLIPRKELLEENVNTLQLILIGFLIIAAGFLLFGLINYWNADISYSNGSNFDHAGSYQDAYPELVKAVNAEPGEPVYKDELSINVGTLAAAFFLQKDSKEGASVSQRAISLSDEIVTTHPNNVVFWKDRVRLFYTLAQGDPGHQSYYLGKALRSIEKAKELAPTDAKVSYNYGVSVGQTGDRKKAIEILSQTVRLKPDYRDAYFALGLFYHELGENQKAAASYHYILKYLDPNDQQARTALKGLK